MYAAAVTERMDALGGFANYGPEKLAALALASVRSARRWIRSGVAPALVVRWLQFKVCAQLAVIHPKWDGWTLRRDGKLHSPEGFQFAPDELRAIPLRYQEISALRLEIRQLAAQPVPALAPRQPCSLNRRQSVSAAKPSADTIRPTTTPSAMRDAENFTDAS